MKLKIGTQLEEEVCRDLKAAVRENKPINEPIQLTVGDLPAQTKPTHGREKRAPSFSGADLHFRSATSSFRKPWMPTTATN